MLPEGTRKNRNDTWLFFILSRGPGGGYTKPKWNKTESRKPVSFFVFYDKKNTNNSLLIVYFCFRHSGECGSLRLVYFFVDPCATPILRVRKVPKYKDVLDSMLNIKQAPYFGSACYCLVPSLWSPISQKRWAQKYPPPSPQKKKKKNYQVYIHVDI